jgi:hypothetical protein
MALHPFIQQGAANREMEVRRPIATHRYTISWYRPLGGVSRWHLVNQHARVGAAGDSFPTCGTNGLPGNGAAEWLLGVPLALL